MISSEDIRCFFYLFKVPLAWRKFLGFNKRVPESLVPGEWRDRPCVLTACVLPMGFVNSASIAQHVHRNIVAWSQQTPGGLGGECEMRKDRVSSRARAQYRVYLDSSTPRRLKPSVARLRRWSNTFADSTHPKVSQGIPRRRSSVQVSLKFRVLSWMAWRVLPSPSRAR